MYPDPALNTNLGKEVLPDNRPSGFAAVCSVEASTLKSGYLDLLTPRRSGVPRMTNFSPFRAPDKPSDPRVPNTNSTEYRMPVNQVWLSKADAETPERRRTSFAMKRCTLLPHLPV